MSVSRASRLESTMKGGESTEETKWSSSGLVTLRLKAVNSRWNGTPYDCRIWGLRRGNKKL